MFCENCGHPVDNTWRYCPHCGYDVSHEFRPPRPGTPVERNFLDTKAVIGFVLSLVGFCIPPFALFVSLPALLLGIFSIVDRYGTKDVRSKYFAIAAIVISSIGILLAMGYMLVSSATTCYPSTTPYIFDSSYLSNLT